MKTIAKNEIPTSTFARIGMPNEIRGAQILRAFANPGMAQTPARKSFRKLYSDELVPVFRGKGTERQVAIAGAQGELPPNVLEAAMKKSGTAKQSDQKLPARMIEL